MQSFEGFSGHSLVVVTHTDRRELLKRVREHTQDPSKSFERPVIAKKEHFEIYFSQLPHRKKHNIKIEDEEISFS